MDSNSVEPISPPGDARPASARSHSPPAPSRKVIDPDGDLSLKIPPSNACKDPDHEHQLPLTFVVCSRTLSRASHIWKALLHGRYAESKPSCASSASDWVVELPDVNPKALETILNIIHSRFESLPRTTDLVSLEDLYQLTLWTYEYDLTAILRPWASVWMKSAREKHESWRRNNTSPVTSDLERLSWIASEMGDAALLDSVLRDLAIHCPVDARGNPQNNTGTEIVGLFNSTAEPLQFYDAVRVERLMFVENLLAIYSDAIAVFTKRTMDSKLARVCIGASDDKKRKACDAGTLGTIILSLASSGYWPLPAATDIRKDVTKLVADLSNIDISSPFHGSCTGIPGRSEKIKYCLATPLEYTSLPGIKERMAKQSAKLGID